MTKLRTALLFVAVAALCISGRHAVKAAGPLPASGSASIKGTVRFDGIAPKAHSINMAADPSCARLHSTPAMVQDIVTDNHGDLENVIVFVADGLEGHDFTPPPQQTLLEQKGCMFVPHVLAVQAGQQVEVVNDDPTGHNIHPMPSNNREWNKAEPPGSKMDESFGREEIAIPVKCNIHPWMHSYVAVFKHPYFVVTGKDGSFDLSNLPPGTYTIEAWHEKLGSEKQQITVAANESKAISFVFKGRPGM